MHRGIQQLLLAGSALAATTGVARAQTAGTPAGTIISNQAQASYTVGGTPQTTSSNVSTFVVDRKANFTLVREQTGRTEVTPGQAAAVTTFRLTNLTNGTQDFILDPDQGPLSLGLLPGTDDFDVDAMRVFVDMNDNGIYDPLIDTRAYVDQLAADTSVVVFVVADIPNRQDASLAFVSLQATIAAGTTPGARGDALVSSNLNIINDNNEVDVVFADGDSDGAGLGDAPLNGQLRAYAAYEVRPTNVDLSVTKSSRVITDNLSLVNPRAMPGSVVEYCLVARNATLLTPASDVTLTDVIPANTTYQAGSLQIGALGGATGCLVNGVAEDDDANDAGELDPYRGSFDTAARRITATIPTLLGGGVVAVSFRVTID